MVFLFSPIFVFAQEKPAAEIETPKLQMPIPGVPELSKVKVEDGYISVPWLAEYIAGAYKYGVALAVSLTIFMIMLGGFFRITAAGSAGKIEKANKLITDAVIGLILAFGSYVILFTINPDLVGFQSLQVKLVKKEIFIAETEISLETGGFDADTYPEISELTPVSGNTPAAKLASVCKSDPGSYEGRIANLKTILPTWIQVCKNGCVYIKGGFTKGCKSAPAGKRMAEYMFLSLSKKKLTLPPDCNTAEAASGSACYQPLAEYYRNEMVVPSCNAGMVIGDCLTWSHQLLNCAGKTKYKIPQYRGGKAGETAYLVFAANGIDAALEEINKKGGLKFGDVFWSEAVGHNFMYVDTDGGQIVEMGGFGMQGVNVPGVGELGTVKVHSLQKYLSILRNKEKKPLRDIKTYIYRPFDY